MQQKTDTGGSHPLGLGLLISKSIIEAHEGKMWAENNLEGRGATFYFTLPLKNIDVSQ
jgi:signal transduction histidine kinase